MCFHMNFVKFWDFFWTNSYNEIEVGATIGICLEKEKSMENPYSFQAVDKCRNCMSQQPVLMRKSAKNVII